MKHKRKASKSILAIILCIVVALPFVGCASKAALAEDTITQPAETEANYGYENSNGDPNVGSIPVKGSVCGITEKDGVETNIPVNNAVVTVYARDKETILETISVADTDGSFECHLPIGNYSIAVEAEGYITSTVSFEVTAEEVYLPIILEPNSVDLDNLVTDAFCDYTISYDRSANNYRIPMINLFGEAAQQTNSRIYDDLYHGVYEQIEKTSGDCGASGITYMWAHCNNIVSILAKWMPEDYTGHGPIYFVTYNASAHNGGLLSLEEVVAAYDLTEEEFHALAKQKIEARFIQENGSKEEYSGYYEESYSDYLEYTLSDENVRAVMPFIDMSGDLCIVAEIYSVMVEARYNVLINLTGNNVPQEPEFSWKVPDLTDAGMESQSTSERIGQSYKQALQNHPEFTVFSYTLNGELQETHIETQYTLYDIDKDGINELIVKENLTQYYIYTFDGESAVLSNDYYWSYSDCLYKCDGNGLIVHDGGSGSMRIEYVILYKLENGVLKEGDCLVSTEEDTYDELKECLNRYARIDNFYPITDYSQLESE